MHDKEDIKSITLLEEEIKNLNIKNSELKIQINDLKVDNEAYRKRESEVINIQINLQRYENIYERVLALKDIENAIGKHKIKDIVFNIKRNYALIKLEHKNLKTIDLKKLFIRSAD